MLASKVAHLASFGLRVLSLACRKLPPGEIPSFESMTREEADENHVFLGLAGVSRIPRDPNHDVL